MNINSNPGPQINTAQGQIKTSSSLNPRKGKPKKPNQWKLPGQQKVKTEIRRINLPVSNTQHQLICHTLNTLQITGISTLVRAALMHYLHCPEIDPYHRKKIDEIIELLEPIEKSS